MIKQTIIYIPKNLSPVIFFLLYEPKQSQLTHIKKFENKNHKVLFCCIKEEQEYLRKNST